MSAGGFDKADAALATAAQHVGEARADLEGQLQTLGGNLASLASAWQGAGASAFQVVWTRWEEQARTVLRALESFEQALTTAERGYDAADDASSQALRQLASRLGG